MVIIIFEYESRSKPGSILRKYSPDPVKNKLYYIELLKIVLNTLFNRL